MGTGSPRGAASGEMSADQCSRGGGQEAAARLPPQKRERRGADLGRLRWEAARPSNQAIRSAPRRRAPDAGGAGARPAPVAMALAAGRWPAACTRCGREARRMLAGRRRRCMNHAAGPAAVATPGAAAVWPTTGAASDAAHPRSCGTRRRAWSRPSLLSCYALRTTLGSGQSWPPHLVRALCATAGRPAVRPLSWDQRMQGTRRTHTERSARLGAPTACRRPVETGAVVRDCSYPPGGRWTHDDMDFACMRSLK